MSVRPITTSEEKMANGQPFVFYMTVFGGLQGVISYFHAIRSPVSAVKIPH